jgi:hypothetical protein
MYGIPLDTMNNLNKDMTMCTTFRSQFFFWQETKTCMKHVFSLAACTRQNGSHLFVYISVKDSS